jgi:hypothetical protein
MRQGRGKARMTRNDCPCLALPAMPTIYDPEEELLVVDVPTDVVHRCLLCGRKVTVQHIPGDYVAGDDSTPMSKGIHPKPILPAQRTS